MGRRTLFFFVAFGLLIVNFFIFFLLLSEERDTLTVTFLDVGQGDAILIESPTGVQLLIDGGKDRSVLRELGAHIGPFDRSIDLVLATHPDADHIGGLAEVLERYAVRGYLSSGVKGDTSFSMAMDAVVSEEPEVTSFEVRRGDRIHLGGGAYLDILFPDRDVQEVETNTGSVVARLVYGETSFLLTGDAPESIEEYLVTLGGELESDVLKAGHHGSKTSTGEAFLAAVFPGAVVVSAGEGNSYGHPHEEVVERVEASGAILLSTMGKGAVVFESNGERVVLK